MSSHRNEIYVIYKSGTHYETYDTQVFLLLSINFVQELSQSY